MNTEKKNENAKKVGEILYSQERKISCEYEKRLIQIGEAAKYLFLQSLEKENGATWETILSDVREYCSTEFATFNFHPQLLAGHKRKIGVAFSSLREQDKIILSDEISRLFSTSEPSFDYIDLLSVKEAKDGVITYVKNITADKAYDAFSSCFDETRVLYSRNFDECCEQVARKNADYCILPLSSLESGELYSVKKQIDMRELKICAVYKHATETDSVTYALLSDENRFILDGAKIYFEFSLGSDNAEDVKTILSALAAYGLELYKIASDASSSGEGFTYRFTVEQREGNLLSLVIFLEIFFKGWKNYGLYSEI